MDDQELKEIHENSGCISLKLQSSKCPKCCSVEETRRLRPKAIRPKKLQCIKPWEKLNLDHKYIARIEQCRRSRDELQELGYSLVDNLDSNLPDSSCCTPSLSRQRITKRFIEALTPQVSSF